MAQVYNIEGEDLTMEDLVEKHGAVVANIIAKAYKSEAQMIQKTATTEMSRAKRMHKQAQVDAYLAENPDIVAGFEPFNQTVEDFIEDAEAKVKAGLGQRT